jgi:hypothetical protein
VKRKARQGGRKKGAGERYPGGRLKPRIDQGTERTIEDRARFRVFQSGKGDQWAGTPIGRAWLVGLLDGYQVDAAAIRDAGLLYAELYWAHYPAANAVANYEGEDRRGSHGNNDRREILFMAMDEAIRSAGRDSRNAVHDLVIDCHWTTISAPWLERLVNERLIRAKVMPVVGLLPMLGDTETMKLAAQGLLAVAAGTTIRRAA